MKLKNKVAVITGGYKGIGKGIVEVFVSYGAQVVVLDYDEEVNKMANENIITYKVDIRNKEEVENAIEDAHKKLGKINILINNAGVCVLEPFETTDDNIRNLHFGININGVWNATKACLKYLKEQEKSTIVNLSSVTGPMVADPGEVAYATTKGAVLGFTKSLAADLASTGIRVNAIMPGYIRTPLVEGMAKETDPDNPENVINGIANAIPLKRLGTPKEVGELAAFLASEESSYITAQGIVIDGGSTLPETSVMGQ